MSDNVTTTTPHDEGTSLVEVDIDSPSPIAMDASTFTVFSRKMYEDSSAICLVLYMLASSCSDFDAPVIRVCVGSQADAAVAFFAAIQKCGQRVVVGKAAAASRSQCAILVANYQHRKGFTQHDLVSLFS